MSVLAVEKKGSKVDAMWLEIRGTCSSPRESPRNDVWGLYGSNAPDVVVDVILTEDCLVYHHNEWGRDY